MARVIDVVNKQLVVDVAPVKHGKWVNEDFDWICSVCGNDALTAIESYVQVKSNYCPHCGAKMDGGK